MSDGMNRVILLGRLGADPELRTTHGGVSVLNLRLATNESYLDRNKERQERTEWHHVVVWGARAEALHRVLSKGSSILVEGGLRTTSYERDGVTRYKTEVYAREICFAGSGRREQLPFGDDVLRAAPPPMGGNGKNGSAPISEPALEDIPF
jgi:single-strand DNA-binding protein